MEKRKMTKQSWIKKECEELGGVFVDPNEQWKWYEKLGMVIVFIILLGIFVMVVK